MAKRSLTVMDLPSSERPRERLRKYGAEALTQQELLAVILGRGTAGKPVLTLAHDLLYRFKDLTGIAEASLEQLTQVEGIGLAKAAQLKAAADVARRLQQPNDEKPGQGRVFVRAQDVFDYIRPEIKNPLVEHFFVLMLNSRGGLIRHEEVSKGSLNATVVHPREVFKAAIAASAAAVILIHNHPSGDPEPSDDDVALTKRLVSAGQTIGISVQDHIIVTDAKYASLKCRNLI
jgi:DNA repair protein RadC